MSDRDAHNKHLKVQANLFLTKNLSFDLVVSLVMFRFNSQSLETILFNDFRGKKVHQYRYRVQLFLQTCWNFCDIFAAYQV